MGILDLADEPRLTRFYPQQEDLALEVACLGPDTVVWPAQPRSDLMAPGAAVAHLAAGATMRCAERGQVRSIDGELAGTRGVLRIAGDKAFLVVAARQDSPAAKPDLTVFLGEAGGIDKTPGSLRESHALDGSGLWYPTAATSPDGRLVAVVDNHMALLVDHTGVVVNRLDNGLDPAGGGRPLAALSPSVLIRASSGGDLHIWHDPRTTTETPRSARVWPSEVSLTDLAWSPVLNRFLALGQWKQTHWCQ